MCVILRWCQQYLWLVTRWAFYHLRPVRHRFYHMCVILFLCQHYLRLITRWTFYHLGLGGIMQLCQHHLWMITGWGFYQLWLFGCRFQYGFRFYKIIFQINHSGWINISILFNFPRWRSIFIGRCVCCFLLITRNHWLSAHLDMFCVHMIL